MIYKPFGKTGKNISAISFGAMRFKPEEYKAGPEQCAEILLRAKELGVNLFDTAPLYCDDKSEGIVGCAMRQIRGERPYVATKCGFGQARTADEAYAQVQKSRDRLCIDTIDFFYMWCIRTIDEYWEMIKPGGVYEGLLRAQSDGLITHICTSTHVDGDSLATIAQDGKSDVILLGYNALNFAYRRGGLLACHEAGVGTVVMNPLGGGIIPRYADKFSFLKQSPDESIAQSALRFLIGQKEITAALPGPASIAELEDCVAAADHVTEVTEQTVAELAKHLSGEMDTLCTSCGYCDHCPADIPIVELMTTYNTYMLEDNIDLLKNLVGDWWNLTPDVAGKCTACGVCEKLCTQHLPIIERLGVIAGLAD